MDLGEVMVTHSNWVQAKEHILEGFVVVSQNSGRNGSRTHEECNKNLKSTGKRVVSHFPLMLSMRPLNFISATGIFSLSSFAHGKKIGPTLRA